MARPSGLFFSSLCPSFHIHTSLILREGHLVLRNEMSLLRPKIGMSEIKYVSMIIIIIIILISNSITTLGSSDFTSSTFRISKLNATCFDSLDEVVNAQEAY